MLRIIKVIGMLMIVTVVNAVAVLATTTEQDSLDFAWEMHPSKTDILPGEPVLLVFDIRSLRDESVGIDFGSDGISAFSIEIQDASKNVVGKCGRIEKSGLRPVEYLQVLGKGHTSKKILLNQWVSTLQAPGDYTIICEVQYSQSDKPSFNVIELTCQIKILERNDKNMDGILLDIFATSREAKTSGERDGAARMICFSDSEQAARYQMLLVRDRSLSLATRNFAVQGLGRVGSEEAADCLSELCVAPCLESFLHDTAVLMVYDQAWGDTPEMREFISMLKKMHKRPIRPKVPEPIVTDCDWMGYWYIPITVRMFRPGVKMGEMSSVSSLPWAPPRIREQPVYSGISINRLPE